MKKLIRSEKNKLIERAKTLIIVLLFLLCLLLGYRILKLYNAQTNVDRAIWGGLSGGADIIENSGNVGLTVVCDRPQPQSITVNSYSARKRLAADSQMFDAISELSDGLIGELYMAKSEGVLLSNREEWQKALNSDSVYIKYPLVRNSGSDAAFYGMKSTNLQNSIREITQIIIAYDQSLDGTVMLFAADKNGENIVKTRLGGDNAEEFKKKAKKLDAGDKKEIVFAWELNLDKKTDKDKTALNSMLMLSAEEESAETVSIDVPRLYKSGMNFTGATDLTLGLVNAFNYNPSTIRQYVNSDNSIMFVGETGSLSLRPEGVIEYKALDSEDGVILSSNEGLGDICLGLGSMIEKLMRISGINTANADFEVKLTGVPQAYRFNERCGLEFDYFVGDKKVILADSCGIRAVVQRGRLVEMKMHLKDIRLRGEEEPMEKLFDAIDRFCETNPESREVSDAYGVYVYREDGADIKAEWKVEGAR